MVVQVALLPCLFKIRKLMVRLCGCFESKLIFSFHLRDLYYTAKEEIYLVYIKPRLFFFPQLFYDVTIFLKLIPATALQQ